MKNLILLIVLCFSLTGCSVLKTLAAPFKNTVSNVPQSKIEGKAIIKCVGDLLITKDGSIKCTKGYYSYNQDSNIQERKLSLKEKIIQFFNNLAGVSFWVIIGLIILCPSLIGLIAGRLFEGIYGIGAKAFKQVATAIQKIKSESPNLITELEKSTDENIKIWIADFKKKNNIK